MSPTASALGSFLREHVRLDRPIGKPLTVLGLPLAEDLDPVEAVLGNLRFHSGSCIWAFPESTLSQLTRAENASPPDWIERGLLPHDRFPSP